jgi:hypothetical protein
MTTPEQPATLTGTCTYCGHDVTGLPRLDPCPDNQDGDTQHNPAEED